MKPRCYIAGPIARVPDFRARFAAAVPVVESLGYDPVNPCDITPAAHYGECPPGYDPGEKGAHASSACFMRSDLRALLDCDAIYMLPGWRESRGATVEHTVAVACGIPVLEEGNHAMTKHATPTDLRAAIQAALPTLTEDQARRARDLLVTLTPPMEEPTWPGAPVIAACDDRQPRLHTSRNDGPGSGWECDQYCVATAWARLANPRPLTPAEYAEHRIPMPCTHTSDEETP